MMKRKQAAETPVYPTPEPESSFQGISLGPRNKASYS
jgi:hypothetical protein